MGPNIRNCIAGPQMGARTDFLKTQGFRVARYWNTEAFKDFDPVLNSIYHELRLDHPSD